MVECTICPDCCLIDLMSLKTPYFNIPSSHLLIRISYPDDAVTRAIGLETLGSFFLHTLSLMASPQIRTLCLQVSFSLNARMGLERGRGLGKWLGLLDIFPPNLKYSLSSFKG